MTIIRFPGSQPDPIEQKFTYTFGNVIHKYRSRTKYNQHDLAKRMGVSQNTILSSCIELGMKLLSAAFLILRLGFFGTSITEPITWTLMLLFLTAAYLGSKSRMFSTMAAEKGMME